MPYRLIRPETLKSAVVFASPHSGRYYPAAFLAASQLDAMTIRSSEDAFVDLLIEDAPRLGAPLLLGNVPRAFVDFNRSHDELDPALVEGVRRVAHNPRVTSGLGVIPRVVANGRAIYRGKLSLEEAHERINACWHPYHTALEELLRAQRAAFGKAILIDCHSMPHEAIAGSSRGKRFTPEVVLGDRFGASAHSDIVAQIETAFRAEGLRVSRNTPFAGAYITQQYGRPGHHQHCVQVELDRSLYMDEARLELKPDFAAIQRMMSRIMAKIVDIGRGTDLPVAAE
ncbi:MAG: N-formylglutamate amidohydrolase [Mangrovicoccus sp.]|nr:N-formylglutamate amidohydrolase [Mangrovicoccus sp.]